MRRLRSVGLWAVALIAIALIALVVVALTVDPDAYRPALQRRLTQALGREVSIERLSFGWSLRPTLAVRSLSIANPAWASRPLLLTARQGAVSVDLVALWHGHVEIGSVTLEGVDVLIERDRDGSGNWEGGAADRADGKQQARLPDFDSISLRDAEIGWRDAAGHITRARIDTATAVVRADKPFELKVRGTLRDTALAFDLKANASLQSGLQGGPITTSLTLKAPAAQADLEITMPKLFDFDRMTLKIDGHGERLAALSALAGRTLPDWGPFRVSAQAALGDDTVRLTAVRITVDGLPITPTRIEITSGEAVLGVQVPTWARLTGKIDGADFGLEATTAALPDISDPAGTLPLKGKLVLAGLELAANGSIGRESYPPTFDLSVDAKGDVQQAARILEIVPLRQALPVDLSARIASDGQHLRAKQLHGKVAGCTIDGDLALARTQRPRLTGTLDLGRLDLSAFDGGTEKQEPTSPKAAPGAVPGWVSALDADLRLNVQRLVGLPVAAAELSGHAILADGHISVRGFRGSLAETLLAGDADLRWRAGRPQLDATLRVPALDLAKLTSTSGSARSGRGLDTPLPLAPLRAFDADLQVDIDRVQNAPLPVERLRISARLASGRLTLSPLQVNLAGVPAQGTFTVDAGSDDARLGGKISAAGIEVVSLLRELNTQASVSGRLGPIEVTVDTHGATPRAWAARAQVSARAGASTLSLRDAADEIRIGQASATATPGAPVRAQLRGSMRGAPFELSATGGPLAELLDAKRAWPRITGELRTTVREKAIQLTALTGPLERLTTGRDVPIRIEATTDGARATATGTIADLRNPVRTPLHAEIAVDSLARLPFVLRVSPLPDIPLSASASVELDRGSIALDQFSLRAGESDLSGRIRVQWAQRLKLNADLSAQALDLTPWLGARTSTAPSAEASTAFSEVVTDRLDEPFPLEALRAVDGEVRLRAGRVTEPRRVLTAVELEGKLDGGVLDASAAASEGEFRLELRLDARDAPSAVAVRVSVKDLDLESLKVARGTSSGSDFPRLSLRATMAGRGLTPRQVYASAAGDILFTTGPGRVREVASPYAIQDVFRTLLTTLTPGRKPEDYNSLECAAARFDIVDGVATSPDGIALRFKRMDILGSGGVNLSTREILFGFKAVRRQWLSFSTLQIASDFVRIGGTLERPRVELDPGGLLIRGGAAGATMGISILATDFLRKLRATENPCAAIVARGRTSQDPLDAVINTIPLAGRQPGGQPPAGKRERQ